MACDLQQPLVSSNGVHGWAEQAPLERLIVTAATAECGLSLLAMLGSLNVNWPGHPPIVVYDLGLDANTLATLEAHRVCVKTVPASCLACGEEWALRCWCLRDAPSLEILWIAPRVVVLQALDDVFDALREGACFVTADPEPLDPEEFVDACRECALPLEFRFGKRAFATEIMGYTKGEKTRALLDEALDVARRGSRTTAPPMARRSQAIVSLLVYKYFDNVVVSDSRAYACTLSPRQEPEQKVWIHRDKLLMTDVKYLAAHLTTPADRYVPSPPFTLSEAHAVTTFFRAVRSFARGDLDSAEHHLRQAVADTGFMTPARIASVLHGYRRQLRDDGKAALSDAFVPWATAIIRNTRGRWAARRVQSGVHGLEGVRRIHRGDPENGFLLLARSFLTHPSFVLHYRREIAAVIARAARADAELRSSS